MNEIKQKTFGTTIWIEGTEIQISSEFPKGIR